MNSTDKTTLEKSFSREHTLFYFGVWQENNLNRMEGWAGFNADNILFVRDENGSVSVWYNPEEIKKFNQHIKEEVLKDKQYFENFKDSFEKRWSKLAPYMKDEKKIKDLSELKEFYNEWTEWWTLMVMSMNIPEISGLPEDIKEEALELRKQTQEYMDEGDRVFADFFKDSFSKYEEVASVILPSEVFDLGESGLSEERLEEIKDRKSGCAILNGEVISQENLAKELKEQGLVLNQSETKPELEASKDKLQGQVAYEGKASGRVKIVTNTSHLKKVKEGDIIISPMTMPDFVPAMRRAAAFVTDEGGITSHAAITAREMEKPCIVGTDNATEVLNDGDKVKVDANDGIVEITEKNNE